MMGKDKLMQAVRQAMCAVGAAALLAGCGDGDVQEVRDWMKQVERETATIGQTVQKAPPRAGGKPVKTIEAPKK